MYSALHPIRSLSELLEPFLREEAESAARAQRAQWARALPGLASPKTPLREFFSWTPPPSPKKNKDIAGRRRLRAADGFGAGVHQVLETPESPLGVDQVLPGFAGQRLSTWLGFCHVGWGNDVPCFFSVET